jgi:hypothetical protein
MFHIAFAAIILFILILLLSLGVMAGSKFGHWKMKRHNDSKLEVVAVAEGMVFALLGLLIAFTFSGAYDRYQQRMVHIIEEANAYETAYLRLGLLAPETQADLRESFREYLDTRLGAYKKIPDFAAVGVELDKSKKLQDKIWDQTLAATQKTNNEATTELLIPAINAMFDEANTGYNMTQVHSPAVIFILLISLATLGAFLSGYASAESKAKNSLHIMSYIAISVITIFLTKC